jgi:hypothetical protein
MPFNKQSIVALLKVRADEHTYEPTHLGSFLQAPEPSTRGAHSHYGLAIYIKKPYLKAKTRIMETQNTFTMQKSSY